MHLGNAHVLRPQPGLLVGLLRREAGDVQFRLVEAALRETADHAGGHLDAAPTVGTDAREPFLGTQHGRGGAVGYQTQPLRRGDLSITVVATGNLQATNQVQVGSELSGILVSLQADYNDMLQVGHPLAYLEIIAIDPAAPPPARARWRWKSIRPMNTG